MPKTIHTEEPRSPTTRDHLLQVGLRRIRSMGYASTGVKEILDDADVPKGSFYHHFASKEAFAKEVLELYVRGKTNGQRRSFATAKPRPSSACGGTSRS